MPACLLFLAATATQAAVPTAQTADEPAYVVILRDGRRLAAKTKPVAAFGKLRYVDAHGKTHVLPASQVDLSKTREINSKVPTSGRTGTLSIAGGAAASPEGQTSPGEGRIMATPTPGRERSEVKRSKPHPVTVYSATWCDYCRQLKSFLAKEGIAATVIEVDRLPAAEKQRMQQEMRRLTGKVSYPTVVIGDRVRTGFAPNWILKTVYS